LVDKASAWHRYVCAGLCAVCVVLIAGPAEAGTAGGEAAVAVVTRLHTALIEAGAGTAGEGIEERYERIAPVITDTHDLPYIARFSLRRYWDELSGVQRETFVAAFSRLSITTYAARFGGATSDTFLITGQSDGGRGRVQVEGALLLDDSTSLQLVYVLHYSDAGWKIINIVVDGVSDLALKRSAYQRTFLASGFTGLLDSLDDETARIAAGADAGSAVVEAE